MTTPTTDIDEHAPRIEKKAELIERLARGAKPAAQWRVGTEHEKVVFHKAGNAPVEYEGKGGIKALLDGIAERYDWQPISEGGNIIGLKKGMASVSLEPGGQFELSGAPLDTIHETCSEITAHLNEAKAVGDDLGLGFLSLGFSPKWTLDETPMMPKGRYKIMRDYMARVGRLGRQMMFRSCTVQSNLDFASEVDMVKKMRVSLALQPVATALLANSPFAEGRTNGFQSYRAHVWTDTDPDRTGMLPFAFESGFGFEQYVDYALDVPMYFVRRKGKYVDVSGQSFRAFIDGKLPGLPGDRPSIEDWDDHISTIFPEVRLKSFLEMRGADTGPQAKLCGLSAFWVGLLYDSAALDGAWELVKGWTAPERESLRRGAPFLGLATPGPNGRSLQDIAKAALALSRTGLTNRARKNASGKDETIFLNDLDEIAASGLNGAQRLLALYNGAWKRDIDRVFTECVF
jgi:glutamate--cysteine ligase